MANSYLKRRVDPSFRGRSVASSYQNEDFRIELLNTNAWSNGADAKNAQYTSHLLTMHGKEIRVWSYNMQNVKVYPLEKTYTKRIY